MTQHVSSNAPDLLSYVGDELADVVFAASYDESAHPGALWDC